MHHPAEPPDPAASSAWQPPSPEELQTEFHAYEIIGLIGVGGMGAVYQARQLSLDRIVAIKILPPDHGEGAAQREEQFTNEARVLARLHHPQIVSVHDSGVTPGGLHFLCMEHFDGFTLFEKIGAERRLSGDLVLRLMVPICEALHYAHGQGVIHRDIKPENILINHSGHLRVADFGLARLRDIHGTTRPEVEMGSPDYVAPEVYDREAIIDGRADIYSLGVMLHQMLTGAPLRPERVPASQLVQCDPGFDAIILKATAHDPARRYATAGEMKAALERLSVLRNVPVRPGPKPVSLTGSAAGGATAAGAGASPGSSAANNVEGPKAAPPVPKKDRRLLVAGIAIAGLLAVAGGWILFGGGARNAPSTMASGASSTAENGAGVDAGKIENPFGEDETVLVGDRGAPIASAGHSTAPPAKSTEGSKVAPPPAPPKKEDAALLKPDKSGGLEKGGPIIVGKHSRYQFHASKAAWEEARKRAAAAGGQLACITSREELEFVGKKVIDPIGAKVGSVWIGASGEAPDKWRWVSGEPFRVEGLWLPNQPNVGINPPSGQYPAYLGMVKGSGGWGFNDFSDSAAASRHWSKGHGGYLVEYPLESPGFASNSPPASTVAGATSSAGQQSAGSAGAGSAGTGTGTGTGAVSEIGEALNTAEANFRKALEKEALGSWKKASAALTADYRAQVERAYRAATQAGNLDDALACDEEKKRLATQAAWPASEPLTLPAALKTQRQSWRAKFGKLHQDHERRIRPLYEKYLAWLSARITDLTKQNKLSEARLAQEHHDRIATEPALVSPFAK